MYEHVEFHIDNSTKLTMPITLISNSLDYVSLEIMPPVSFYSSNNKKEETLTPQTNLVRLNEKTLKSTLKVHERFSIPRLLVTIISADRDKH